MKANLILIFISCFGSFGCLQKPACQEISENFSYSEHNDEIRICKWKNDSKTCVIFSFDDNNKTANRISRIFDTFNYKTTFFINAKTMLVDSVRDIISRGHEIGNHTFSHKYFHQIEDVEIENEIVNGKNIIESTYKIKCLSFAEPGRQITDYGISVVLKNHLYARNYSEYKNVDRLFFASTTDNIYNVTKSYRKAITTGNVLNVVSHGIDGEGYMPIATQTLIEVLDSVKVLDNVGLVWVATIKEGICYENIYRELLLDKMIEDDLICLNVKNFNSHKYKDMDSVMLSIYIPANVCNELISYNKRIIKTIKNNGTILSLDLKKDTSIVIMKNDLKQWIIEAPNKQTDVKIKSKISIYPNPFNDVVFIDGIGAGSQVTVYDSNGFKQMEQNESVLNTSRLNEGQYIFRIKNSLDSTMYRVKLMKEN